MQYQKMQVVGNVGKAPARIKDGSKVYFDVAVNEQYGEEEHTTWFRVWTSNGLSENVEKYVVKGQNVLVEGRLNVSMNAYNGAVKAQININATVVRFGAKPSDATATEDVPTTDDDSDDCPF